MKTIELTKGKTAIVDDEDFEELSKYKWYYGGKGYAVRNIALVGGKQKMIFMHSAIMGKIEGFEIDHANGDELDNRKENLRCVTHQQNMHNKAPNKKGSSQYKGVCWNKKDKRWRSQIGIGGKRYHLGSYESEQDAAWVYNVWAESFFGKYARLNMLEETT